LHQGGVEPTEPSPDDVNHRQRWKEEGKPEPPRHEAPEKPHEIFAAFVAKSLDKLAVGHVSSDLEEGLVAHGTKVLKLSHVYATQLVRDVAHVQDLLLQSDTRTQTQADEGSTKIDPRLQVFLDRATPILAQNRGLNARSRVLLGAMAEEVGLATSEVDAAVALLETKPAETDGLDAAVRERLAPFRRYAVEMLGQLPHKILTGRVHTMMVERGEERFGIDSDLSRTVLRELAVEQQIQVISEEEATRHIEGLVEEHLGDAFRLETSVKQRIQLEGGQWGLSEEQIEKIIKQGSRRNYQKRRSEQNLSNAALVAALIAVLLVAAFLGWTMLGTPLTPTDSESALSTPLVGADTLRKEVDDSWWSVNLTVAILKASNELPLLQPRMKEIASPNVENRANAYEAIIRYAFHNVDDLQRSMLLTVISQAYVDEPDDATAAKIRQGLVRIIPGPEDRLSEQADDYPRIFEAMRGAVAALHGAAGNDHRADDMARSIGQVVGTSIDRNQPLPQLERQCLGALAERLFRLMIASAASRPADTVPLHRVISAEAGRYLDPPRLETLNADFLAAFLPARADSWNDLEDLIDETVQNRDPLIVASMIDVYETTANSSLRSHLETHLLRRAGVTPSATEIGEIADEIRQALGITEVITAEGRTRDFMQIAERELVRPSSETDERIKAADLMTRLSRVATLGCALAQGETGFALFDEMIKVKPAALSDMSPDDDFVFPTLRRTDWDALARIDSAISRLQSSGASNRVDRIESIARDAESIKDLQPKQARLLATYLLTTKTPQEHERIREHLPKFGAWVHLHLALADGVTLTIMDGPQMQEMLSALLGKEITLGVGDAGREAIRGVLLRRALIGSPSSESSVPSLELIDRARELLLDQYTRQANVLGVPRTSYADAQEPAEPLKAIIQHYTARVAAAAGSTEAKRQLGEIPHQLQAIEYIATNRLQQTVLLERIWLQLLATDLKRQSPKTSEAADQIIRDLHQADRTTDHSLAQLHASQSALVRMWMLWNRPK